MRTSDSMELTQSSQLVSPWRSTHTLQRLPVIPKVEITALEQERAQCMKDGRIKAALLAEQQLQEMKLQQESEQMLALQELHTQEAQRLEQQAAEEFTRFTENWDAHMATLQESSEEQQQLLLQKHLDEVTTASAAAQPTSQRMRPSPELLNLRRIQATLLAQKQFEQALQTKHKADALEAAEQAAHAAQQGLKPTAEGARLLSKQAKEQDAQAIRLSVAKDEAVKKQQGELQRLMKRYQAARLSLQRAQATERQQLELRLRAELGIKRPCSTLEAPDLGTSLADTPLLSASCHSPCSSPPRVLGQGTSTASAAATAVAAAAAMAASGGRASPASSSGSSPRSPQRPRTAMDVYAAGPKPLSAGHRGRNGTAAAVAAAVAAVVAGHKATGSHQHGTHQRHSSGGGAKGVAPPAKRGSSTSTDTKQGEAATGEPQAISSDASAGKHGADAAAHGLVWTTQRQMGMLAQQRMTATLQTLQGVVTSEGRGPA